MEEIEKVKLTSIVNNDILKKSDVIICLTGDGFNRIDYTAELFKRELAEKVVISGGYNNPPFSIPAKELAEDLIKKGVPSQNIILEEKSQNTYQQALEIMKLAKGKKWNRIILVASHFHQPRAFLTFLKTMEESGLKIEIFNAPVKNLSWFEKTPLGKNRLQLLEEEFEKIERYKKNGHLVTIKQALEYQKWKEKI